MNYFNSPIIQTNEVARHYSPNQDDDGDIQEEDKKPKAYEYKCLLAEDLQKIRRSNHSSHVRREVREHQEEEHDDFIKGLLYPGLEESNSHMDFFEDDDEEVSQTTAAHASASTSENILSGVVPTYTSNISNNHSLYNAPPSLSSSRLQDFSPYYYPRTEKYSDLGSEKMRR